LRGAQRLRELPVRTVRLDERLAKRDARSAIPLQKRSAQPRGRHCRFIQRIQVSQHDTCIQLRIPAAESIEVDQAKRGSVNEPLIRMRRAMNRSRIARSKS
jgi:hypothetical protein